MKDLCKEVGFFYKNIIKVCATCFDVLGTPRLTPQCTVQLYIWQCRCTYIWIWSSVSNALGNVEGSWRVPCQLKKALTSSETETRELLGGTKENKLFSLIRGVIDLTSGQINECLTKEQTDKYWAFGQTCQHLENWAPQRLLIRWQRSGWNSSGLQI